MDDQELFPYLAGFFDGEGSVSIDGSYKRGRWVLRLNLRQVNPAPLNVFAQRFGGTVRRIIRNGGRNGNDRNICEWNQSSHDAYTILKAIRPYLTVKAAEADLGIAFQEMIDNRSAAYRTLSLTDEERAQRHWYYQEIRALKRATFDDVPLVVGPRTAMHKAYRARRKLPKIVRAGNHPVKPRGTHGSGQRSKRPDEQTLRQDYLDLGPVQTAIKYGVGTTSIYNWLDHYGIPRSGVTEKTKERFRAAQKKSYDEYRRKLWGEDADRAIYNERSRRWELPLD